MLRIADPATAFSLFAALLCLMLPGAARSRDVAGTAAVVSANVIAVGDTRIRLAGIEGPRPDLICIRDDDEWECGRSAVDYMREVIGGQTVRCTVQAEASDHEAPNHGMIARCLAGRDDLALKMVLAGYAFAYRREGDEYTELEGVARRLRRGLWASDFVLSWDGSGGSDRPR